MQIFLVVVTALLALGSASKSYSGYKVFDVTPTSFAQSQFLKQLSGQPGFDFWSLSRLIGHTARVMVEPNYQAMFEESLAAMDIDHIVTVDDVEEFIIEERLENEKALRIRDASQRISFNAYYRHDQINSYLDELAVKYPNLVTVKTEGLSFENRPIKSLRISSGGTNKPIILIDAGIHAREWAAPASALYIIYQLLENSTENTQELLSKVDWIILPTINPDGYEYTFKINRLWRKTRSNFVGTLCRGTDGNRNFAFHWMGVGTSFIPCFDNYAGPRAFSEPETRLLRDIMLGTDRPRIKLYFTLHSYGRYLLYPWGYTSTLPSNWKVLDDLANSATNAIRSFNGARYEVGSSSNTLYPAAGGSDDYAMGVAGIPLSYTLELPGGGGFGFDPPPSQIKAIVDELYVGFKVLANYVKDNY